MAARRGRGFALVWRWVLGMALLAFLVGRVRWGPIVEVFSGISPLWLTALVALGFALIWVSCLKWRLFLGERKRDVSLVSLMSLYLVGYFFSHFLPSQYGGDLVRSYELGKKIDSHVTSFGSVFLERYTGLVALMAVSGLAAVYRPDVLTTPTFGWPILAAWVLFLFSLWLILDRRPVRLAARLFRRGRLARLAAGAIALHDQVRAAGREPKVLVQALALSLLFHWLAVVNVYLGVLTLRGSVEFFPLMIAVPIALMVSMIPLTVNSIGLFEAAFVFFLTPLGLSGAEALSVALILRGKNLLMALLGGMVYLLRSRGVEPPGERRYSA